MVLKLRSPFNSRKFFRHKFYLTWNRKQKTFLRLFCIKAAIIKRFSHFPHDSFFSSSLSQEFLHTFFLHSLFFSLLTLTFLLLFSVADLNTNPHRCSTEFSFYWCNNGYKNSSSYFNNCLHDTGNYRSCSTSIDKSCWGKSNRNSFFRRYLFEWVNV